VYGHLKRCLHYHTCIRRTCTAYMNDSVNTALVAWEATVQFVDRELMLLRLYCTFLPLSKNPRWRQYVPGYAYAVRPSVGPFSVTSTLRDTIISLLSGQISMKLGTNKPVSHESGQKAFKVRGQGQGRRHAFRRVASIEGHLLSD